MAAHLGHGKQEPVVNTAGNTRNGKSRKAFKGEFGALSIEVPRDRHGTFEPQRIPKHQNRVRRQGHLALRPGHNGPGEPGASGRDVRHRRPAQPDLLDHRPVAAEVKAWQARPLDLVHPIVYLDCIHVKVCEGAVRVKAVYLAIGVTLAGEKEALGMWLVPDRGRQVNVSQAKTAFGLGEEKTARMAVFRGSLVGQIGFGHEGFGVFIGGQFRQSLSFLCAC